MSEVMSDADTKVREETRTLPSRLSTEERGERANEMAHELQTIEGEEEARKSANSAAKARIDERKAKVKRLALEISTGIVHREVKVRILHLFKTNTYREERMDTGEKLFERALTLAEREPFENPELPFPAAEDEQGEDDDEEASNEDEKQEPTEAEAEEAEDEDDGIVDDDYEPDGLTEEQRAEFIEEGTVSEPTEVFDSKGELRLETEKPKGFKRVKGGKSKAKGKDKPIEEPAE